MKISTGLRNSLLSGNALKAALAGGEIRIYAGAPPADADAAVGASILLCTIKNAGAGINFDTSAAAGVLLKSPSETWSGTNVATNTATFYRHVLGADDGTASATAPRIQGSIAVAGADMNLTSVSLVSGASQNLDYYSVAMPTGG